MPPFPRHERKAWWRMRRGLRKRLFGAFGVSIGLAIGSVAAIDRLLGPIASERPFARVLAFGLVFLLLWALAGLVSGFIAFPIVRLASIVRSFGEGDFSVRARVHRRSPAEVRELGDAFDAMADRIDAQIRGQRELMAAVSHELRTPLARLRLVLELGRDRGADPRTLADAESEIEAIDGLVGTLLAGARLDAGALTRKRLDLVELAREAVVRASERSTERSYALEAESPTCFVEGDPALVARALAVLLDNADKHGGPNVVVRVRADARLEVEDDGEGVIASDRERIFEPFVRGAGKDYDERRGVGLGLHLVRRIAEAHGGSAYLTPVEPSGVLVGLGPFEKA